MNGQTTHRETNPALPLRQVLLVTFALMVTLLIGQLYHTWQSARMADQVAAQTALIAHIQATRASMPVSAPAHLPVSQASSATTDSVIHQDSWVF